MGAYKFKLNETTIMEEDYAQKLITQLKEHQVFKAGVDGTIEKIDPPLKEVPANTFKKICEFSSDGIEQNLKIENEKTKKSGLTKYLMKRYNKRIATKIVSLFDWSAQFVKYEQFFKTIEVLMLRPTDVSD